MWCLQTHARFSCCEKFVETLFIIWFYSCSFVVHILVIYKSWPKLLLTLGYFFAAWARSTPKRRFNSYPDQISSTVVCKRFWKLFIKYRLNSRFIQWQSYFILEYQTIALSGSSSVYWQYRPFLQWQDKNEVTSCNNYLCYCRVTLDSGRCQRNFKTNESYQYSKYF